MEDKGREPSGEEKEVNDLTAPDDEWNMGGATSNGNQDNGKPATSVLKFIGKLLLWFIAIVVVVSWALFLTCMLVVSL